jgi:voltage-gated potassium channel
MTHLHLSEHLHDHPDVGDRVRNWERATEWPLAVLAALFLGAYAWPILDPAISPAWRDTCQVVDIGVWVLFAVEFVTRMSLTRHRVFYLSRHLHDVAVIVLPILRPLRLLRLVMLLRVLNRSATDSLRGRIAIYVSGSVVLLVFCASLAVLDAERHAATSNIKDFGTALWWSIVTITTVGYGDHFPVTFEGRAVGVGLMIGGIALLGVVTASIASWLIDRVRVGEEIAQSATRADIHALSDQIGELQRTIMALQTRLGGT